MASVVKIKRSSVSGKRPTTSNIETGELALNLSDGRLYSSDGTDVFEIGANVHSLSVGAGAFSIANGAITFPTSDGSSGYFLKTDGAGTLSWDTAAGAIGSQYVSNSYFQPILANTNAWLTASNTAIEDRMQVANTVLLVNDRLQVANADALYVSMSGDTMTGPLDFGDNVKARFGDADDLQIYHGDTLGNYIVGTGTNGKITIQSSDVTIRDNGGNLQADFSSNGSESRLFYQGNEKLATKTGGVDITGDITVSGTVDGVDIAALDLAVDDRMQVANVISYTAKYLEVANATGTDTSSLATWAALTSTNTAIRALVSDRLQVANAESLYVSLSGDTMTGTLILNGAPTADLHAATKKYVDDEIATVSVSGGEVSNAYLTSTYTTNTAFQSYVANTNPRIEALEDAVNNNNLTGFPFFTSDGTQDNINSFDGAFPFYLSNGTQDNIPVSF